MALHPDAFLSPRRELDECEQRLANPLLKWSERQYLEERALVLRAAHPELTKDVGALDALNRYSGQAGSTPASSPERAA